MYAIRTVRRGALILAIAVMVLVGVAGQAQAHAFLKRTTPAAGVLVDQSPRNVSITYSGRVQTSFATIRVFNSEGSRVDAGPVTPRTHDPRTLDIELDPDLPDGTYTVASHALAADGHPVDRMFVFHVGAPGRSPSGLTAAEVGGGTMSPSVGILGGVVRGLNLTALLVLAGGLIFWFLIWHRKESFARPARIENAFRRGLTRMVGFSWATLVVTTVLGYILYGAAASGVGLSQAINPTVLTTVASTQFGRVSALKFLLLFGGAILWSIATQTKPTSESTQVRSPSLGAASAPVMPSRIHLALGGVMLLVLLATPGLTGHAVTVSPVVLSVGADALHMLAAAAWMGGLAALLLVAMRSSRDVEETERVRWMTPVVGRFSSLATVSVIVLVLTGTYRAWAEVGALDALFGTTYGTLLLVKIGLFVPLLGLGALNNIWTRRRLKGAVDGAYGSSALSRLRRSVAVEVILGIVVVGVTAALVNATPASMAAGAKGPVMKMVALPGIAVHIMVTPARAGKNEIHIEATGEDGGPVSLQSVGLSFELPEKDIRAPWVETTSHGPGLFVGEGHQLSIAGDWIAMVRLTRSDFTIEEFKVQIPVEP